MHDSALTVGEVAERFGVTVRTLHHYDDIGLLVPAGRSDAGYRLYSPADLERLSLIVAHRRLGFSLDDVRALVDAPPEERRARFEHHRRTVLAHIAELNELVRSIERVLETRMNDTPLTDAELGELLGDGFDDTWRAEAEARWGDTDAWRESRRRTATHTRRDWEEITREADEITAALAEAHTSGSPPSTEVAMDVAERHRAHISRWFYECPPAFHVRLGELYATDERFLASYDRLGEGLAAYMRAASVANAERQTAGNTDSVT